MKNYLFIVFLVILTGDIETPPVCPSICFFHNVAHIYVKSVVNLYHCYTRGGGGRPVYMNY